MNQIYEGTYELKKDTVSVHVRFEFLFEYFYDNYIIICQVHFHFADITFVFSIRNLSGAEEGGTDDLYAGNHNVLKLIQHTGEITRQNNTIIVQYDIPMYSNFLFYRFYLGRDD